MKNSEKHPLIIRMTHWLNVPLLTVMIWSGALIYWSNDVYWPHFSEKLYETLGLSSRLAEGLSYHFFFMWFFAINGLTYALYLLYSGQWREICPTLKSFKEAGLVFLHDLGLKVALPPSGKFNGAQKFAYTGVIIMGLGSILTGLAIYKPVQLHILKNAFGNYDLARKIHFYLTIAYVLFFIVHVAQVAKSGWVNFCAMVGPTSRSFVILFTWFIIFASGFSWMRHQEVVDGLPKPFRKVLEFNERLGRSFVNSESLDVIHEPAPRKGTKPRFNGSVGLEEPIDASKWRLTVASPIGTKAPALLEITLAELKKLPRVEQVTEMRCIEGWSQTIAVTGVRFSDFLKHYGLGTRSGSAVDFKQHPEDLFTEVGLETPDGEYYVSIDMKSMLSPQTLLAYELNGFPLDAKEGAPLRLIIPNKYGVKNIKRIGKIQFADTHLPDYWGEQGYDWFIGL
jgi:thiosulfate reductase cytochrome b subunit